MVPENWREREREREREEERKKEVARAFECHT